ncbi:hypothetical protein A4K21_03795 [Salmonella enterica subsp. enterica serovar Javiana]|nr:hypothetical protein [Salmonella enterica subsp. enterica serovar Javiana]
MKMNVTETVKQACGHWPNILPALGVKVIKNRHQSCPVCGGSDRFRFDDKEGRGTWFCNQCGAGDGLKLVEKVFGVTPSEAAGKVNAVTGSRRRVIIHFPEQIAPEERDPQLRDKIARELAVIVHQLMQKFSDPMTARALLQSQQNSDEALSIKRDADPTFDFCGYLEMLPQTSGMFMGNASIIPRNYRKYLYHAYLAYMEANGYRNVLSLKMFGLGLPMMLKEYGLNYEKRHTKLGIQTNLTLREESYGDWLPKCDDPTAT